MHGAGQENIIGTHLLSILVIVKVRCLPVHPAAIWQKKKTEGTFCYLLWQHYSNRQVRFMHIITTCLTFGKDHTKIPGLVASNMVGDVLRSPLNYTMSRLQMCHIRNIQWCNKYWCPVPDCSHWLGSLMACISTTLPWASQKWACKWFNKTLNILS